MRSLHNILRTELPSHDQECVLNTGNTPTPWDNMARNILWRVCYCLVTLRFIFMLLEVFVTSAECIKRNFNTERLKQAIIVGALVYLYICALVLFHSSSYSPLQRNAKDLNTTINNLAEKLELERKYNSVLRNEHYKLKYLWPNFTMPWDPINLWIETKAILCDGNFVGYGNLFAELKDVVIDPKMCFGKTGGESMSEVMGQSERDEYLRLYRGYFQLNCQGHKLTYHFNHGDHQRKWLSKIKTKIDRKNTRPFYPQSNFTIAVLRYEYANLYHVMTDWYNAFLMLMIFKKEPFRTTILFMDSHPKADMDDVWFTLFGNVLRAGKLEEKTSFNHMAWSILGYHSLLNQHKLSVVPYLEEFRNFFLSQHKVEDNHKLDCEKLSILFIWRRDYIAHPRNPKGRVKRKVKNEKELERAVQQVFPSFKIQGLQMDNLSMKKQLEVIVDTDILIGMHGAGLSLSLFVPSHASLIELYPKYMSKRNKHFRSIAKWRHLKYLNWQNQEKQNEFPDYYTYIPIDVVVDMMNQTVVKMCSESINSINVT